MSDCSAPGSFAISRASSASAARSHVTRWTGLQWQADGTRLVGFPLSAASHLHRPCSAWSCSWS